MGELEEQTEPVVVPEPRKLGEFRSGDGHPLHGRGDAFRAHHTGAEHSGLLRHEPTDLRHAGKANLSWDEGLSPPVGSASVCLLPRRMRDLDRPASRGAAARTGGSDGPGVVDVPQASRT